MSTPHSRRRNHQNNLQQEMQYQQQLQQQQAMQYQQQLQQQQAMQYQQQLQQQQAMQYQQNMRNNRRSSERGIKYHFARMMKRSVTTILALILMTLIYMPLGTYLDESRYREETKNYVSVTATVTASESSRQKEEENVYNDDGELEYVQEYYVTVFTYTLSYNYGGEDYTTRITEETDYGRSNGSSVEILVNRKNPRETAVPRNLKGTFAYYVGFAGAAFVILIIIIAINSKRN